MQSIPHGKKLGTPSCKILARRHEITTKVTSIFASLAHIGTFSPSCLRNFRCHCDIRASNHWLQKSKKRLSSKQSLEHSSLAKCISPHTPFGGEIASLRPGSSLYNTVRYCIACSNETRAYAFLGGCSWGSDSCPCLLAGAGSLPTLPKRSGRDGRLGRSWEAGGPQGWQTYGAHF